MNIDTLLTRYQRDYPRYEQLQALVHRILSGLLAKQHLKLHSLTSRLKEQESLKHKMSRPDRTYRRLYDVKDLCGFRLVTYFEDAIPQVASLIESHFHVDFDHSVDKRRVLSHSQFGYNSLHYVVSLPESQGWAASLCCIPVEIQIRTILQHAWAEIEHDLGYKSHHSIPALLQRQFSRLASLLELADEEFVAIKNRLSSYKNELRKQIDTKFSCVSIDQLSLASFVESQVVQREDLAIADLLGMGIGQSLFFPEYLIKIFQLVGIKSIADAERALIIYRHDLGDFVTAYFHFTEKAWGFNCEHLDCFLRGYSLFFLGHILAYRSRSLDLQKVDVLAQFYQTLDYPDDETSARAIALLFVSTMREHWPGARARPPQKALAPADSWGTLS